MLALIAVLLAVSAVAWIVLACELGGSARSARPATLSPPPAGPTFVAVAPGATLVLASRVLCVSGSTPVR